MKVEHSTTKGSQAIRITIQTSGEYESFKNILKYAQENIERSPYGLRHQQMNKDLDAVRKLIKII